MKYEREILKGEAEVLLGEDQHGAEVPLGEVKQCKSHCVKKNKVEKHNTEAASTDMDYLLSLVGKDQDTIVEAIKDLAENSEKVKKNEKEIIELHKELEENKEEIHYLKNKLDQKYDIIEDMEHELKRSEEECKDAKKETELKEKELQDFDRFISKQVEEMNILQDNNLSMVSQIGENIRMEQKIYIQNKIIKDLQGELSKEKLVNNGQEDLTLLNKEVKELQDATEKKQKLLEQIENENKDLERKLEQFESEKIERADSLSEQLEIVINNTFRCEECEQGFQTKR